MRDSTSSRPRMSLEDRAKIFIPFNPLAGFTEALRERERRAREAVVDFHPLEDDDGSRFDD
ncbi:MAG: hypothetical protein K5859_07850 [Atopobiaceae bacterium]|nr:hypothetical protein [Atopobiaceae bacterium]